VWNISIFGSAEFFFAKTAHFGLELEGFCDYKKWWLCYVVWSIRTDGDINATESVGMCQNRSSVNGHLWLYARLPLFTFILFS